MVRILVSGSARQGISRGSQDSTHVQSEILHMMRHIELVVRIARFGYN
jgi:hypothetical protein